jgi:hypothetical protein
MEDRVRCTQRLLHLLSVSPSTAQSKNSFLQGIKQPHKHRRSEESHPPPQGLAPTPFYHHPTTSGAYLMSSTRPKDMPSTPPTSTTLKPERTSTAVRIILTSNEWIPVLLFVSNLLSLLVGGNASQRSQLGWNVFAALHLLCCKYYFPTRPMGAVRS